MDRCTVLLAPDVTGVWDTCAWMALDGKLTQVDFESYVDEAAIVSDGVTKERLRENQLSLIHMSVWLEEPLWIIKAGGRQEL